MPHSCSLDLFGRQVKAVSFFSQKIIQQYPHDFCLEFATFIDSIANEQLFYAWQSDVVCIFLLIYLKPLHKFSFTYFYFVFGYYTIDNFRRSL
jgi:hypothetical protein